MTTIIGCIRKNEKWIDLSYYVLYAILYLSALVGTTTFMDWEGVPHVRNLFYMGATAGMLVLWMLGIVLQENWKVNVAKAVILLIGIPRHRNRCDYHRVSRIDERLHRV